MGVIVADVTFSPQTRRENKCIIYSGVIVPEVNLLTFLDVFGCFKADVVLHHLHDHPQVCIDILYVSQCLLGIVSNMG